MRKSLTTLAAGFVSMMPVVACADVKLPAIFGDHMVLQGEMHVPIWGTADADEKVSISIASQRKEITADAKGNWRVELEPIRSNDPLELVVAGNNTITIKDVLVGDVWLCSGQSNMGFMLKNASNAKEAVSSADRRQIRLFTVGRATPERPLSDVTGEWTLCSPESAAGFSAVGYFFGVELQEHLNRPIGLIHSSWGGTRAEAWIPKATFDALKLPYEPEWTEQWLHPKTPPGATKPAAGRPHEAPAVLWNGMVAPVSGFAMRGVIWYQGETNTAYPEQYDEVLTGLIMSWRDAWKQGDFPFLIVQLAGFDSGTRDWPTLREAQARVARDLPNAGLAVTIDVGEPKDIHPKDKMTVGKRLAMAARKVAYGEDIVASGPVFRSADVTGNKVTVHYDHADSGLTARSGIVKGFELAGADGKFVAAEGAIEGNTVILTAPGIAAPTAIRYAWANVPECSLYNAADLPAVPFRSKLLGQR